MLTPETLRDKAKRRYPDFLKTWLLNEPFSPLVLPVGKLPNDFNELRLYCTTLQAESKAGYTIILEDFNSRKWGKQALPTQIMIESEINFLRLIEKTTEFANFKADVFIVRHHVPELEHWLCSYPLRIVEHHGEWAQLIQVCEYVRDHTHSGVSLRELPVNVHTKFVETHTRILRELLDILLPAEIVDWEQSNFFARYNFRREIPLLRMRFLDNQFQRRYGIALTDMTLPLHDFNHLDMRQQRILIIENKTTFLSIPELPDTIAVFGQGFAVEMLSSVNWLHQASIIYWGDLDAQGFQILALLRAKLPNSVIKSVLMDEQTLHQFSHFMVAGTPTTPALLTTLTHEEHALYLHLVERNLRLEQERVSMAYAIERLIS